MPSLCCFSLQKTSCAPDQNVLLGTKLFPSCFLPGGVVFLSAVNFFGSGVFSEHPVCGRRGNKPGQIQKVCTGRNGTYESEMFSINSKVSQHARSSTQARRCHLFRVKMMPIFLQKSAPLVYPMSTRPEPLRCKGSGLFLLPVRARLSTGMSTRRDFFA